MIKTSNKNARQYVCNLTPFTASNTFAINKKDLYIVYSYGEHFPMFIYDKIENKWLENNDKYSSSTSKHQSQLHPWVETDKFSTKELQNIINSQEND